MSTTGNTASDVLTVGGLKISKSFTNDPVAPNAPVTLQYVIDNLFATAATAINFTDNLNGALAGLAATGLPASNVCGAGSQLSGTGTIALTGASLAGGASCTFSATLQVPGGTAAGEYASNSSPIQGTVGAIPRTGNSALDKLVVINPAPGQPDLIVGKANTVGGATTVGTAWQWRSTLSNAGDAPASFSTGQAIYSDTMPRVNIAYGTPSIGSSSGVTGTINCVVSGGNMLDCTANGAVSIAAGGSFRVDVSATASATGTYTNPTGGTARVDPTNSVSESNEANNNSNSDAVVVSLALVPASLDFGGQSMNTTSPAQAVTLTNSTGSPLTVSSVSVSTYFAVSHDCTTVAPAASCTANVTFTPTAEGALNGTLTLMSSAGTQTVPLTGTGERSLVTHYYYSILRRAPDAGGKAFWEGEAARMQSLGVNLNETWYSMASSFFTSAEYLAFNRDNTGFVTDLYKTFFNRDPDAPGLAFWKGLLDQGMPREVMLASFMFSTEFVNFTQAIFGNTAVRKEIDMVVDFYRGLLARLPDNSGFAFWVQQFRTAQCQGASAVIAQVESISSQFATGAEYAARARSNSQYVGDLYNAFLRRGGDLAGVQFWINQIATSAQTREQVRQQFVASPEEFQVRVQAIIAEGCLPPP